MASGDTIMVSVLGSVAEWTSRFRFSQSSRTSFLVETLFGEELRAGRELPAIPTVDHSRMLNVSELRVLAEWVDLGGQYYNDAHDDENNDGYRARSEVRGGMRGLSGSVFEESVQPVLLDRCAGCHQPFGLGGSGFPTEEENPDFRSNRLVLTGSPEGDLNVSVSMVNDVCNPAASYLLAYPTSDEFSITSHPRVDDPERGAGVTVLTPGEPDYQVIYDWIASGNCQT